MDLDLGRRLGGPSTILGNADVLVVVFGAGILDDEHRLQVFFRGWSQKYPTCA